MAVQLFLVCSGYLTKIDSKSKLSHIFFFVTVDIDKQLADLLKSTPGQFTQWLNNNLLNCSSSKSKTNDKKVEKYTVPNNILFTKSDIQFYEEIYSHLITTSDSIDDSVDV